MGIGKVWLRNGVPAPDSVEGQKYIRALAAGKLALDEYAAGTLNVELDRRQTLENMVDELIEELTDEDIDEFDFLETED